MQIGNHDSPVTRGIAQDIGAVGLSNTAGGRRAAVRHKKPHKDTDLSLFMAFQGSTAGGEAQARVTRASERLSEALGGYDNGSGGPVASIFERLGDVVSCPGVWVLRKPLSDDELQRLPGALTPDVLVCVHDIRNTHPNMSKA